MFKCRGGKEMVVNETKIDKIQSIYKFQKLKELWFK